MQDCNVKETYVVCLCDVADGWIKTVQQEL